MKILVIHPFPEAGGGAEIQLFRNLSSFQSLKYQITLVTLFKQENKNLKNLAKSCDINIENIKINSIFGFEKLNFIGFPKLLGYALVLNYSNYIASQFDLIHTVMGECTIYHPKVVQHFCIPLFSIKKENLEFLGFFTKYKLIYYLRCCYILICRYIARYRRKTISHHFSIANSKWTKNVVKQEYPNIKNIKHIYFWPKSHFKNNFKIKSFDERDNKIIMLGRIVKSKNFNIGIELVNSLKKMGLDYKLIIIGRSNTRYSKELFENFKDKDNIEFIFDAKRDFIFNECSKSKYGLHGFKYEHFGSAAIEMRSASLPTFVPAYGGQAEISNQFFTYKNKNQLLEKIIFFENNPIKYLNQAKKEFNFYQNNNHINYIDKLKSLMKKVEKSI